jgi:hypothetical protein
VFRDLTATGGGGGVLPIGSLLTLNGTDAIIWLDADLEVKTTGDVDASPGDAVIGWDDQTSYVNDSDSNFYQNSYSAGTALWNDKNYVELAGVGDGGMMIAPENDFSGLTELTLFITFKKNETAVWQDEDFIVGYTNTYNFGADVDGWNLIYKTGGNLEFTYKDVSVPATWNRLTFPFDDTKPILYTIRVSGNTIDAWSANTSNPPIWSNSIGDGMDTPGGGTWFNIGSKYALTGAPPFPHTYNNSPIDIGSVVVYDGPLSNSDVKLVQDNLVDKYNYIVPASPSAPAGSMLLDLDATKEVYADDGVTLATDGQDAYRWSDQSGGSNDAVNVSGLTQPSYHVSGDNSRPYVHLDWFDSGGAPYYNEWMTIDNSSGDFDTQVLTVIAVVNSYRTSPSTGYLINNSCSAGESVNAKGWSLAVITSGDDRWSSNMQSVDPVAGSNFGNAPAYTANTTQIIVQRFSAGTVGHHYVQVNNEAKMSGTTVTSIDFGGGSDVLLNARYGETSDCSDPSVSLGCYLYRMVVYDEYLDDTTINNFIAELNTYHNVY